jgi:Eukaryotic protein of unknown function (DUF829)
VTSAVLNVCKICLQATFAAVSNMEEVSPLLPRSTVPRSSSSRVLNSVDLKNTAPGLEKLSPTVYFSPSRGRPGKDAPSAILIFAWMGAPIRHMTKFIEYYSQTMFPNSPIILVLQTTKQFMANEQNRRKDLLPAFTAYQSLNVTADNVLVHLFSNGGINSFRTFVQMMDGKSFSPRELVVDSAPGIPSVSTAVAAFTADIKNPFVLYFMSVVLRLMFLALSMKYWLIGGEPIILELRRWLADEHAVGKKTNRVYLYSDGDALVEKDSVESHIDELKEKGFHVSCRNFGQTRHVGHMRANPEVYWAEILEVWKH